MTTIRTKIYYASIPSICPECNARLHHVNALNTRARVYMVFCTNKKCRYCREFKPCPKCGELLRQ